MKKFITVFAATVMLLALFTGCATVKTPGEQPVNEPTEQPGTLPAEVSEEPEVSAEAPAVSPVVGLGGPSDSYNAYVAVKTSAYDRLNAKISENQDLSLSVSMSLLPVAMTDLSLIPLTIISMGEGGEAALEILGMNGLEITQNGNEYTLIYNDQQGSAYVQTCKYDPATDSMQSVITDNAGKESIFFEYVKTGSGYASQYFIDNGDGTFTKLTSFINDKDISAFGIESSDTHPDSILGNTSLTKDFVVNGESYFILEGNTLTVFEKGETQTY